LAEGFGLQLPVLGCLQTICPLSFCPDFDRTVIFLSQLQNDHIAALDDAEV
jgi:hypothetical protein